MTKTEMKNTSYSVVTSNETMKLEGNTVNYNYSIPSEYKADVIALMDKSITDIKTELYK